MNWKKITILWCITVAAYSLCAMERDFMQVDNINTRCYIAELPFDLLSLLSEYIIESDEEFVERAKLKKRLNVIPHKYNGLYSSKVCNVRRSMSNWCCHGSMLAILEYEYAAGHTLVGDAQLILINTQKNAVCYSGDLEQQKYKGVAISERGDLFATIHEHLNNNVAETVLTIKDIITKEKQSAIISNNIDNSYLYNVHIGLNVQATKVVLCEEFHPRRLLSPIIYRETIIPILIKTTSNIITPLGMYFARNIICKSLPRQLEY